MESHRARVHDFLKSIRPSALEQWRQSGGRSGEQSEAYREAFVLVLSALALDAQNSALTDRLRSRNSAAIKGLGGRGETRRRPQASAHDDYSDGSAVQARLIEANVRRGKPEELLEPGVHEVVGSSGVPTKRVVVDGFATPAECELVIAGTVLALAGGFCRNGQSTLGISPALVTRLAPAAAAVAAQGASSPQLRGPFGSSALRTLYELIERVRRRVLADLGDGRELFVSDAQVARLQPVDEGAAAHGVRASLGSAGFDPWDVGLARGDQFSYWRPHIDQVSVRSYDFSALLYLADHGADFEGGRLVLHDPQADRVVLPRAARLVLFPSGAESVHAVERVTRGTRFAMTVWFTRSARDAQPDPEQREWLAWARADADAARQTLPPAVAPAAPSSLSASTAPAIARVLPSRLDALRLAALCTLPGGDPLCQELVTRGADGSISLECVLAEALGYDPTALAPWHACSLEPGGAPYASAGGEEPQPEAESRSGPKLHAAEWLHPRVEACAALLMALSLGAGGAAASSDAIGRGADLDVGSKKPRGNSTPASDAFSVFD